MAHEKRASEVLNAVALIGGAITEKLRAPSAPVYLRMCETGPRDCCRPRGAARNKVCTATIGDRHIAHAAACMGAPGEGAGE